MKGIHAVKNERMDSICHVYNTYCYSRKKLYYMKNGLTHIALNLSKL